MKTTVLIFIIAILCSQCSARKRSSVWKVKNVKTNYVQKGINDEYELSLDLKGKGIGIQDSLLIITEIRKNYVGSALSDEFGDTINFEKKIFFKKRKDDKLSIQYPGNEFMECMLSGNDTCLIGESFLNFLEVKGNGVNAYLSSSGKHSKTKCILFIVKENKEMVLFSENDFLLLFLTKNRLSN